MRPNNKVLIFLRISLNLWLGCYLIFMPVIIDQLQAENPRSKPVIGHQPVLVGKRGESLFIEARVSKYPEIAKVTLALSLAGKTVHGRLKRVKPEQVPVIVQPLQALTLSGRPSPSSNIVAKVMSGSDLIVDKKTKYYYLVTTKAGERGYVLQNQVRVQRKGYIYGARLKPYYTSLDTLEYRITATSTAGQQASVTQKVHIISPEHYEKLYRNLRPPESTAASKSFYRRPVFWIGTAAAGILIFIFVPQNEKKKTATVNLHADWE